MAISNNRIEEVDETHVTYTMTPSGTQRTVTKRVPGADFVRGFVQHVLPPGFHKIRYYGWQHPRRTIDREEVRWLACAALGLFFLLRFAPREPSPDLPPLTCAHCGGELKLVSVTFVNCAVLVNYCRPFLDSG